MKTAWEFRQQTSHRHGGGCVFPGCDEVNLKRIMKRMRRSLFLICGLLLTVCNVRAEEVTNTYSCRGFDSRSNLVVEGILNISVDTTNRVRGNWNLHNIELTPKIKSKVAHHVAWPVGQAS